MRVQVVVAEAAGLAGRGTDAVVRAAPVGLLRRALADDRGVWTAAGPDARAAFAELFELTYPSGWLAGQALSTTAGQLPARWLIHVAVPAAGPRAVEQLLAQAYRSSLAVADELGVQRLALPPFGLVAPYWPLGVATRILRSTLPHTHTSVREVILMVRTVAAYDAVTHALAA